jgi:hypothetical protein
VNVSAPSPNTNVEYAWIRIALGWVAQPAATLPLTKLHCLLAALGREFSEEVLSKDLKRIT